MPLGSGKYQVVSRLAAAEVAEVYRARLASAGGAGGELLLKRLMPALARQPHVAKLFLEELAVAARLSHPGLVRVLGAECDGDDVLAVLEYVPGRDLEALQELGATQGAPMPFGLATFVVGSVCQALHYVHTATDDEGKPLGLVHASVTPRNVLVTSAGEVKLADFGMTRLAKAAAQNQAGMLRSKYAYMSPEQCRGDALDARSDVFSAGILLYELVCHRRLFRRQSDFATTRAVLQDPIPPPSAVSEDVPDALEEITLRALARDREQRYASALEMHEALVDAIHEGRWATGAPELARYVTSLVGHGEDELVPDEHAEATQPGAATGAEPSRLPLPDVALPELDDVIDDAIPLFVQDAATRPGGAPTRTASAVPGPRPEPASGDARPLVADDFFSRLEGPAPEDATGPMQLPRSLEESARVAGASAAVSAGAAPSAGSPEAPVAAPGKSPEPPPRALPRALLVVGGLLVALGVGALVFALTREKKLVQKPAQVELVSEPAGATIYVNGQERFGTTPLTLYDISPGQAHRIVLMLAGYEEWKYELRAEPGSRQTLSARLKRVGAGAADAVLVVQSEPEGAAVYLNNERRGDAPTIIEAVTSGVPNTLILRKPGYQEAALAVDPLRSRERRTVSVRLVRAPTKAPAKKKPAPTKGGAKAGPAASGTQPSGKPSATGIHVPHTKGRVLGGSKVGERLPKR
ncbi:MAG: protein kinase [Deltaproteobacteria bacterium]|nr:protein kinase [Deltaproteobacteria bacterium]